MSGYRTTHQGCASVLRYVLGDAAHLRTHRRSNGRISFEFDEADGKAAEVAELFFSPDGIATGNARQLLECDRAVRATVGECFNSGEWRNECQ
jgi:hypothetical protein